MGDRLETQEDLVSYFEQVTGRGLKTRADLEQYLACAEQVRPQWLHVNRVAHGWDLFKQIALATLFAVAVIQYMFLDVLVEIAALPGTTYFLSPGKTS